MKMITVRLQGQEVQAALLNPEVTQKYEEGFEKALSEFDKAAKCERGSEGIRQQCLAVIDYVSDIFGEEGAKKIFGPQTDLLTCLDVLGEMQSLYEEQVNVLIRDKTKVFREKLEPRKESDV